MASRTYVQEANKSISVSERMTSRMGPMTLHGLLIYRLPLIATVRYCPKGQPFELPSHRPFFDIIRRHAQGNFVGSNHTAALRSWLARSKVKTPSPSSRRCTTSG